MSTPHSQVSPHELKLKTRKKKTGRPLTADVLPLRQGGRGSGDDDDAPERYLSTPRVADRYDVVNRTIERWERDAKLKFPKPDLVINGRKHWRVTTLEQWERARAVEHRA